MVSVIIRTRDREQFLARALMSVARQDYQEIEAIVVNNGLIPLALKGSWPFPVRVLEGGGELSLSGALNAGIREAQGEYIAILDDDDTWDPAFLTTHVDYLSSHGDVQGSASLTWEVHEELRGEEITELGRKPFNSVIRTSVPALLYHNRFTTNAFVYRREAALKLGLYDESLNELEDWDFNLRFAMSWKLAGIPRILSSYHRRPGQGGSAGNTALFRHLEADRSLRKNFIRKGQAPLKYRAQMLLFSWLVGIKAWLKRHAGGCRR